MKKLMVVAAAALACAAFAQEGGPRPEGGRRGFGPREGMGPVMGFDPIVRMVSNPKAAEKLGLSDDQKAKLKEIGNGGEAAREDQKKVREATQKQIDLMKQDKIDEAAVMAAIDESFELRKKMAKEQAKRVIQVKSILTPEQVRKAHEEMQSFIAERGDRGPRRAGPREGGRRPGNGDTGKRPANGDRPGPKPEGEGR